MSALTYLAKLVFSAAVLLGGAVLFAMPAQAADDVADEMLFYRGDGGSFAYYNVSPSTTLGSPLHSGSGYLSGWSSIIGIDLDGRGQDEMFFYRETDGKFAYFNINSVGHLGAPIRSGTGYLTGWTSVVAIDLDGDGQDEIFFYRESDGKFAYYNVNSVGHLGTPIRSGTGYLPGWTSIVGIDLDGDGQDEMFFYRETDGKFAYYNINSVGHLGTPIRSGTGYLPGWTSIVAVNVNGDLQDEIFFYREDGKYAYYNINRLGHLGAPMRSGSGYVNGWTEITNVNLHGDLPIERVARFTTFFDCCQNRVTNIRTMARAIDGYVVQPGETFSIDRIIGPRTTAKGYVPAPYLQNGQGFCCAIGGGVSQFGTTMHNAVFWGGFDVVSHKPHSGWISRYPLGIEATLVYSSIDYRFTNDTPTPLTIQTSTTGTSLTVELWGNQGGWRMVGHHPRGSRSSSITILDNGGSQAKRVSASVSGSAPGSVRVRRTLTQGGVSRSESWSWHYVS